LKLKGRFFELIQDPDFPSGFALSTSLKFSPCSFLDKDGLCSIYKISWRLKPKTCRDFPYEKGKLSKLAGVLCMHFKKKLDKKKICAKIN